MTGVQTCALPICAEFMAGKRLFVSTTNGTRAFQRVQDSAVVLGAALINRQAVVSFLVENQPETVWIVGAGWEGTYALEDTVCAGAIVDLLADKMGVSVGDLAGNDEMVAAVGLYRQWKDDLLGLFSHASHGKRLLKLEAHDDLKYCSALDTVKLLPIQTEKGVLVGR